MRFKIPTPRLAGFVLAFGVAAIVAAAMAATAAFADAAETRGDEPAAATLPSFTAVTIDGDVVNTNKLRAKVVLLDFWGTWCKPCQAAIPHLRDLAEELEDEPFVLVGIAADTNLGAVRRYTESRGMAWPQILDPDRKFSGKVFQVPSYPTYVLFDREGTMIYRASGFSRKTKKQVDRAVRDALRELQGRYRITDRWRIEGHWTYQLGNEGNFEGDDPSNPATTSSLGDYPEVLSRERSAPHGRLDEFQRHKVRLWTLWDFDLGRVGDLSTVLLYRYDSPRTYSLTAFLPLTETQLAATPVTPAYRPARRSTSARAGPRSSPTPTSSTSLRPGRSRSGRGSSRGSSSRCGISSTTTP